MKNTEVPYFGEGKKILFKGSCICVVLDYGKCKNKTIYKLKTFFVLVIHFDA